MDIENDDPTDVKRKHIKSIQQSSAALPLDVTTEILTRLPVRSIIQFRCVCKSWYALISDPIFVKNHLRFSMEDKDYAHHRLIICSRFSISMDVKSSSISSVLHEEYSASHSLDYPLRSSGADVWIVGTVNGLVFIVLDKFAAFIWNPATRESKRLPQCGFEKGSYPRLAHGFGYDESSSDYKAVIIKPGLKSSTGLKCLEANIYGLKTDKWCKTENFPTCYRLGYSAKFVSGTLNWSASFEGDFNNNRSILSFDMSKETFSKFSQPSFGDRFLYSNLGVLDGSLCLLCNIGWTKVDVWVMKEYGKTESWYKMFSLPFQYDPGHFPHSASLFISKKNEVLLMIGVNFVLYNLETNTASLRVIKNLYQYHKEVHIYIESLVSPFHEKC